MKIIECPRDAIQGIKNFIPTDLKIKYINKLLEVGFDTIDFGSFVSPKAIPQLKDTAELISKINYGVSDTKLLAIIANEKGALDASVYQQINYLGFPFSISETFQLKNTNSTILESFEKVKKIQDICIKHKKELVVYISMAFGNPYNEYWGEELVSQWISKLKQLGINIFSLADTTGVSNAKNISSLFKLISTEFLELEIGVHLHSNPKNTKGKIMAAYNAGCKRIDSAIGGYGGCPMAEDELIGNIATEDVLEVLDKNIKINYEKFEEARLLSNEIYAYSI